MKCIQKLQLIQNTSEASEQLCVFQEQGMFYTSAPQTALVASLFPIQFKMLDLIFKALPGLSERSPLSAHPIRSGRQGMLCVSATRIFFPLPCICLRDHCPPWPKIRLAPSLLTFWKSLKTWLCYQASGSYTEFSKLLHTILN